MPSLTAPEISRLLREIGDRLVLQGGTPYRARANSRAADNLALNTLTIAQLIAEDRLKEIPGVGDALAAVITRLHVTGEHPSLEKMRTETPEGVLEMVRIPGLRPERIKKLHRDLGISSLGELEEAARTDRLKSAKGFGPAFQAKVLQGIEMSRLPQGRHLHRAASAFGFATAELDARIPSAKKAKQLGPNGPVRGSMPERNPLTKEERRVRRAARREKQRKANIGRARKMHLARVESEKSGNSPLSSAYKRKNRQLYVGCSGWFYWHWRGAFYPADLPTNRWFAHYAGRFKTVELNAPFYSWPTVATVESWIRQASRRPFVYTVKVCELITHIKRFAGTKALVRDFGLIADLLGPRMGCFLFQLPPSFHYTPARLKRILDQLDHRRRNVVEFRHKSWWNETVHKAFREKGTIFCSCSGPRLPDELIKTADDVYIRFHGVKNWYRHDYSKAELVVWAKRIEESGAKTVWAYFNNDRDGYAIKNARALSRLLLPSRGHAQHGRS